MVSGRGSFTFRHRLPGVVWTREAADGLVGQTMPVHVSELRDVGAEGEEGRILAARPVDDGKALELTLEVSSELAALIDALTYPPSIAPRREALPGLPGGPTL